MLEVGQSALDEAKVVNMERIDFLEEAFRVIGSKIIGTEKSDESEKTQEEPVADASVTEPSTAVPTEEAVEKSAFDLEEEEVKEEEVKEVVKSDAAKPETSPNQENEAEVRKFFVYANVNIPREEDFTFLVTSLWHWYEKYPHP